MEKNQRHINQRKHNRNFLATIQPDYPDWMVTTAFYVALHAIDAMLLHDGVTTVINHDSRKKVLMQTNRYTHVTKHYLPLYSLCRTIRYLAAPEQWVPLDQIETNVLH